MRVWNKAMLGKLLWSLIVRAYLWARWVKVNYIKDESIWRIEAKNDDPWSWPVRLLINMLRLGLPLL